MHEETIALTRTENAGIETRSNAALPADALDWPSALLAASVSSVAITLYMLSIPHWLGMPEMDIGLTIAALTGPEGSALANLSLLAWHISNGFVWVLAYYSIVVLSKH